MAYLLALPVIYYGTAHVANKILNISSDYFLESECLHDDSQAILAAALSILYKYRAMEQDHPAYKNKILVEEGMDSLEYASKNIKERWFKRNYATDNIVLQRLQDDLERRLRLFLLVVDKN